MAWFILFTDSVGKTLWTELSGHRMNGTLFGNTFHHWAELSGTAHLLTLVTVSLSFSNLSGSFPWMLPLDIASSKRNIMLRCLLFCCLQFFILRGSINSMWRCPIWQFGYKQSVSNIFYMFLGLDGLVFFFFLKRNPVGAMHPLHKVGTPLCALSPVWFWVK